MSEGNLSLTRKIILSLLLNGVSAGCLPLACNQLGQLKSVIKLSQVHFCCCQAALYQFLNCLEEARKFSTSRKSPSTAAAAATVLDRILPGLCSLLAVPQAVWRATCSHWDNCFFCMSLLLLLSDDQVCLNSWLKSCWFSNGLVKCTSKQMKLDHVLLCVCSLGKYRTPVKRS